MALRFEPSRFVLKGKVRQKQTSYKHKHTVREEVSQVWNEHKKRRYKKQSQVLVLGPNKILNKNGGWLEEEIMRLVKNNESESKCKINWQTKQM